MRPFGYLADQCFKTSFVGEKLFYPFGPWFRPYIIPNPATEKRIHQKMLLICRLMSSAALIIGVSFDRWFSQTGRNPVYLEGWLVAAAFVYWLIVRVTFARDLHQIPRASAKLSLTSFLKQAVEKANLFLIVARLILCLLFVTGGVWLLVIGRSATVVVSTIVVFGIFSIWLGYMLWLKLTRSP